MLVHLTRQERSIKRATLQFNTQSIPEAKHVRYLGVMIEPNLKWNRQIELLADRNNKLIMLDAESERAIGRPEAEVQADALQPALPLNYALLL